MLLKTEIPLNQQPNKIDYNSNILLLGSCFVENIGKKLNYFKFKSIINPFGILFHPLAIENLITKAINGYQYSESDIFYLNEQWQCFDAHSKLNTVFKEELIYNLNEALATTLNQLKSASHIVITLGTAWVYKHLETENIVANCHKVPQSQFTKQLLSVTEVENSLNNIHTLIKGVNPDANIILTVSPVRHLKDGFTENQRSKAHLISTIHNCIENWSLKDKNTNATYFPSYEIVMDELRDYRFYADDMIHPNATAINYIWERFKQVWISEDAESTMKLVDTIQKGLAHKPFNPNSEAHQKFLKNLKIKEEALQNKLPWITFS